MDGPVIWLAAGVFALISFVLDLKAEESPSQKLTDLFIGLGFLS